MPTQADPQVSSASALVRPDKASTATDALRINFLLPKVHLSGGVRVAAIYADAMQRRGHEVTVISGRGGRRPAVDRFKDWVRRGFRPAPREKLPPESPFDFFPLEHRVGAKLGPIIASDLPDADVLVTTWWETAEWAASLGEAN